MPPIKALWKRLSPRTQAFIVWLALFMLPPYIEKPGKNPSWAVSEALSASLANRAVEAVWPSLALHALVYTALLLTLLKGRDKAFAAAAAAEYLFIAFLQSTAYTPSYGLVIITSNLAVSLILALYWLKASTHGQAKPPSILLPLALFAFTAPMARTSLSAPPWWPLWEKALNGSPAYAIPALLLDAAAGYGATAFCLFTPLAIYTATRRRLLPEFTLRLTGFTGLAYATLIFARTAQALASGLTGFGALMAAWNSTLHIPLFTASLYALTTHYKAHA